MTESRPRPLFYVLIGILLNTPLVLYSPEWFLIAGFLIGVAGLLVDLHPLKHLSKLFSRQSEDPQNRLKWANKRYYAFLCDPKKRSNYRLKFFCSRSQKEVESPFSATLIALANEGFEFDETRRGWTNIKVSEMDKKFENSFLTFKKLSGRVQGAYFNFNGISYPAGCSMSLKDNITYEDELIFLEFSRNQMFSKFLKSIQEQRIPQVLDLKESDLKVLYATRYQKEFVIFARNLKSLKIEQFIFNTKRYGFERVNFNLDFDESKVLKDKKRSLLFMTYEKIEGILETLTVYRREDGKLEKKILDDGRFRVIEEKDIVEIGEEKDNSGENEDFVVVGRPDENDVYEF